MASFGNSALADNSETNAIETTDHDHTTERDCVQTPSKDHVIKKSDHMLEEVQSRLQFMDVEECRHAFTQIFIEKIREKDLDELDEFHNDFHQVIDGHYNHEEPFRTACNIGDHQIVEFVYDIFDNIDLSAFNHEAFRMSCLTNNIDTALWFTKIDERYRVVFGSETRIDNDLSRFIDDEKTCAEIKQIKTDNDYIDYINTSITEYPDIEADVIDTEDSKSDPSFSDEKK